MGYNIGMATLTTLQYLELVDACIQEILEKGQSFLLGGTRQMTRANLGTLMAERRILAAQYNSEVNGRARNLGKFG